MKPDLHLRWIALVLRWGAYGSTLLLAAGIAWLLFEPDIPMQIGPPIPLAQLISQVLGGNPYAVLQLGILALLATPPLSTLVAGIIFTCRGKYRQAALAFGLMLTIAISLFLSSAL